MARVNQGVVVTAAAYVVYREGCPQAEQYAVGVCIFINS